MKLKDLDTNKIYVIEAYNSILGEIKLNWFDTEEDFINNTNKKNDVYYKNPIDISTIAQSIPVDNTLTIEENYSKVLLTVIGDEFGLINNYEITK